MKKTQEDDEVRVHHHLLQELQKKTLVKKT
jgi:hypothetical protein